ncbi:protein-tyrosine phosphatase-like protein [Mycena sp. CBHHK59/15]|nr:protein-tyrosine phosphatase-like protein [Mycena sp. CBHHK59/15]
MITFDSLPHAEMEAMCTPMHRVLSPIPCGKPANSPDSAGASTGALYLGSIAAMHDHELLHEHHITHLVQVLEARWVPQSEDAGFACHRIDIEDRSSTALGPHLEQACNYIKASLDGGDSVLVHCQQGVSRSAAIVIAYLIRDRGMTYDSAFGLVKERRQCIKPNSGFVLALREWESACHPPPVSR